MPQKVFCIGYQKTGTSSIGAALKALGYRVHRGFRFNLPGKVQIPEPVTLSKLADIALPLAKSYSAFEDNPWCLLYRELDAAYPGSRFILTQRRSDAWVESLIKHFRETDSPGFKFLYGCNNALERPKQHFIDIYERHNQSVLDYFKHRPEDLLVFPLEQADWGPICTFLGRRKPVFRAYPHRNSAESRMARRPRLKLSLG